jgi:hypothetical protein
VFDGQSQAKALHTSIGGRNSDVFGETSDDDSEIGNVFLDAVADECAKLRATRLLQWNLADRPLAEVLFDFDLQQ